MSIIIDKAVVVELVEAMVLEFPTMTGVKVDDVFIMLCAQQDNAGFTLVDDTGWVEITDAGYNLSGRMEHKVYYKIVTADDEVPTTIDKTDTDDLRIVLLAIRGLDLTTPFESATYNSGQSTVATSPTVTSTQTNQIALTFTSSDGANLTEPPRQIIYQDDDSSFSLEVMDVETNTAFTLDLASKHYWISSAFILKRAVADTTLPIIINPTSPISLFSGITHNNSDWRDIVYADGKHVHTDDAPIVHSVDISKCYANGYVMRCDNFSADFTEGNAVTWAGGGAGIISTIDYDTATRKFITIRSWTGTLPANDEVCTETSTGNTCQRYTSNPIVLYSDEFEFPTDIKYNTSCYVTGMTALGVSDGFYFVAAPTSTTRNNNIWGHYRRLYSDADAVLNGTLQSLTPDVTGTATFTESKMTVRDYDDSDAENDYASLGVNGQYGHDSNVTGNNRTFTTPIDMSTLLLGIYFKPYSATQTKETFLWVCDSSENWMTWRLKNGFPDINTVFTVLDLKCIDNIAAQHGTLDTTDIKHYALLFTNYKTTNRYGMKTYNIYELKTVEYSGGTEDMPLSPKQMKLWTGNNKREDGGIFSESIVSLVDSQYLFRVPFSLGTGVFNSINTAVAYPAVADNNTIFDFYVADNSMELVINGIEGDWKSNLITSDALLKFKSTDDDLDYTGTIFIKITLEMEDGKTYDQITVKQGGQVYKGTANITNSVIAESIDTNGAVLWDLTAAGTISNTKFDSNTYDIEISGVGDITFDNITFTNNITKNLNITATTGTINITIDGGGDTPTYDTAGATVNIIAPNLQVEVTGISAGSRLRVYNETSSTEIANEVVAGTEWSLEYSEGGDFTTGDYVRFYITKIDKLEYSTLAVASSASWAVLAEQVTDTIYTANGIDGSTVVECTADFPNVQIDLSDADGKTTIQRIYAWWKYNLTTEDGIADWFGGLIAIDELNYKVVTAILDLHFQNTIVTPCFIEGGYIYRDDITTILDAGTGPIQLDPLKAYIAPDVTRVAISLAFSKGVYIDVDHGTSGTEYPKGTVGDAVNNLTDALAIAANNNINNINLAGTLTLDQNVSGYKFISWRRGAVNVNGYLCMNSKFIDCKLYGTLAVGTRVMCTGCRLDDLQNINGIFESCYFLTTTPLVINAGAELLFDNCRSSVPGSDSPALDYTNGNIRVSIRAYSGGLKFINSTHVDNVTTVEYIAGKFNFDNTNTAGSFSVRGSVDMSNVDESGGATIIKTGYNAMDVSLDKLRHRKV